MVAVDAECERRNGVTFVRATVTNGRTTPQTVCLQSTLEGPVWPPRHGSVIAPEWEGRRWTGAVRPGRTRGIGFASPAVPLEEPLELVDIRRSERGADASSVDDSPAAVLAALEEWSPTRDVLSREL